MIKVLIVDDSRSQRLLLGRILGTDRDIEVVGSAEDPYDAREKIKQLKPDVITLDVEMPRMDGITFLKNLMRLHPLPVVMISTLTSANSPAALDALSNGAVDFVLKRKLESADEIQSYSKEVIRAVKYAAQANVQQPKVVPIEHAKSIALIDQLELGDRLAKDPHKIVAIGSSTGGPPALQRVLRHFNDPKSSVFIVQHLPEYFSATFAARLDEACGMKVKLAEQGEVVEKGVVYVAPGNQHLLVARRGAQLVCQLSTADPVNRHRPAVDVLFKSLAKVAAQRCVAVLMTGMGNDGAAGMRELRAEGAVTIAQDEASCVVYGMPRVAVEMGCVDLVLPESDIATALKQLLRKPVGASRTVPARQASGQS